MAKVSDCNRNIKYLAPVMWIQRFVKLRKRFFLNLVAVGI
jgi:hypothetical protein